MALKIIPKAWYRYSAFLVISLSLPSSRILTKALGKSSEDLYLQGKSCVCISSEGCFPQLDFHGAASVRF